MDVKVPSISDWQTLAKQHGWTVQNSAVIDGMWWARREPVILEIFHDLYGRVLVATLVEHGQEEFHLGTGIRGSLHDDLSAMLQTKVA